MNADNELQEIQSSFGSWKHPIIRKMDHLHLHMLQSSAQDQHWQ